jgi:murein L,D-transpeptidase YcbB/YkuD
MKKFHLPLFTIIIIFSILNGACNRKVKTPPKTALDNFLQEEIIRRNSIPLDSALITSFYNSHPDLQKYQKDAVAIYRKHHYNHIWMDDKGVTEFGHALYSKVKGLEVEGISSVFPYQEKIDGVFLDEIENTLSETETEMMLTNLFLFYFEKKINGIDEKTTTEIGWLLPRKQLSYVGILDSVLLNPELINSEDKVLLPQYFKLRDYLQRYREIEKNGGWNPIDIDPKLKAFKLGDTAKAILQIRERLFITGDLTQNNNSNKYDEELVAAVKNYQIRNGFKADKLIKPNHIKKMNVPVGERIKQIMINMERCRWISPEIITAKEFIVVNIPSYKLNLYRDGKSEFESPVVVGKTITKTVIFSGNMSYIVFSPYWNLPTSIINKEVKPGMAKNPNYLAAHNMEWNNGQVRQKPGKKNSLGLVKFMFPNSNNIYLHDTPSKSLFERESRAFSHGCIRVGKPRDLAIKILENDSTWTPAKIDAAMHAGKESVCTLKNKIPVYIGYFTTWVDEKGEINFFEDIYQMDKGLTELLIE